MKKINLLLTLILTAIGSMNADKIDDKIDAEIKRLIPELERLRQLVNTSIMPTKQATSYCEPNPACYIVVPTVIPGCSHSYDKTLKCDDAVYYNNNQDTAYQFDNILAKLDSLAVLQTLSPAQRRIMKEAIQSSGNEQIVSKIFPGQPRTLYTQPYKGGVSLLDLARETLLKEYLLNVLE